MTRLAILSKNKDKYSETFIHSHKELPFENHFYFGGLVPQHLENHGPLPPAAFTLPELTTAENNLRASLLEKKINVVLAEYGTTAAECLRVIVSLHLPLLIHFHGYDISETEVLSANESGYRRMFIYATTVFVVSEAMKNDVIRLGCPIEKIVLTYYGAHPKFETVNTDPTTSTFLSIGRFVEKKAPYITIIAFRNILQRFPHAKLIMVGDGYLFSVCKSIIKAFGLETNIILKGIQSPDEIRKLMQRCTALLQHSVTAANGDKEGTPVSVMEAGLAGLPVLGTRHGGISDVVIHGETGLIFDELDGAGMEEAMELLLSNPEMAKKMGNQARKRIQGSFSREQYFNDLTTAITRAIDQPPPSAEIPAYTKSINNFISHHLITEYTWPEISFGDIIFFQIIVQTILNKKTTDSLKISDTTLHAYYHGKIVGQEESMILEQNLSITKTIFLQCQPTITELYENPGEFFQCFPWLQKWDNICNDIIETPGFGWPIFEEVLSIINTNLRFRIGQRLIVNYIMSEYLITISDVKCNKK